MITQVVDTISMIQLYTDNNNIVNVLKLDCKIKLDNNIVYLYDKSTSNEITKGGEIQQYYLDYTKLINPIVLSALDLFNIIDTYIQAGVISGDATASNQVIQIGQIQDNTAEQNIFKDANGSIFKDFTTFPQTSIFAEAGQGSWFRYLKYLPPLKQSFVVQLVRPANVTQYTIGDALMDATPQFIEFTNIGEANSGIVNLQSITVFDSSNQAVKPIFNFFFFRQQGTQQQDNVPIQWFDGQGDGFMGHVNGSTSSVLLSPNTSQGNSVQTININPSLAMFTYPFQNVWCIIGLANNYIPTSQEVFIFTFNFKP